MGRKKFYESVEQMQGDLDAYLVTYNRKRPHQGRGMEGRTPWQAFQAGLRQRPKKKAATEEEKAA